MNTATHNTLLRIQRAPQAAHSFSIEYVSVARGRVRLHFPDKYRATVLEAVEQAARQAYGAMFPSHERFERERFPVVTVSGDKDDPTTFYAMIADAR